MVDCTFDAYNEWNFICCNRGNLAEFDQLCTSGPRMVFGEAILGGRIRFTWFNDRFHLFWEADFLTGVLDQSRISLARHCVLFIATTPFLKKKEFWSIARPNRST